VRPRGEHLARSGGAGADVEPSALGHVPRVAAEVVVEEELGLAVGADARRRHLGGVGGEIAPLRRGPAGRPWRGPPARPPPSRPAGADEEARGVGPVDDPRAVASLQALHRVSVDDGGAAPPQQEIVELVATDEVAARGDRVPPPAILHVAAVPLPQPAGVLAPRQLQHVPHRRAQPAPAPPYAPEPPAI